MQVFFSRKRKVHLGNEWGGGDLKVCGIKKNEKKKKTNNHAGQIYEDILLCCSIQSRISDHLYGHEQQWQAMYMMISQLKLTETVAWNTISSYCLIGNAKTFISKENHQPLGL